MKDNRNDLGTPCDKHAPRYNPRCWLCQMKDSETVREMST